MNEMPAEVLSTDTSDDSADFHCREDPPGKTESHIANHDFLTATLKAIYSSFTLSDLG